MKKKCTNSECRKFFTIDITKPACPYCGKKYPRINGYSTIKAMKKKEGKGLSYHLVDRLNSTIKNSLRSEKGIWIISFQDKFQAIKAIKNWTNLGISEAKKIVESMPAFINLNYVSYQYDRNKPEDIDKLQKYILEKTAFERFAEALYEAGCECIRTDGI